MSIFGSLFWLKVIGLKTVATLKSPEEAMEVQADHAPNPQTQSPLFKSLPGEIRTLIWRSALLDGAHAQHVQLNYAFDGPDFERFPCHPQPDESWLAGEPRYARSVPGAGEWSALAAGSPWRGGHLQCAPPGYFYSDKPRNQRLPSPLGVLLSCRMVYAEAIDILYAKISLISLRELCNLLSVENVRFPKHRMRDLAVVVKVGIVGTPFTDGTIVEEQEDINYAMAREWNVVCGQLSELRELRSLELWVDILDNPVLEPWVSNENGPWIQGLRLLVGKVRNLEMSVNSVDKYGEASAISIGEVKLKKIREPAWIYGAQELERQGGSALDKICEKYSRPRPESERVAEQAAQD